MKKGIGIDIGGTNLRVGIVGEDGSILRDEKIPTKQELGIDYAIKNIVDIIKSFDAESIETIGIGAPGPLDAKAGMLLDSPNLPTWKNVNIVEILEDALDKRVYLENDGNVAGLAEAIYGAGKDYNSVTYITLSTGVGGGIVLDKKLITGAHGIAAEIGNIILDPTGVEHSNMNKGCFESFCSGTAILREGIHKDLNVESTLDVFRLADSKDVVAVEIIDKFIKYLGMGMSNIIHVFNPDIFVLGGGVTKSLLECDLMDRVYESVQDYQFDSAKNKVIIEPAKLDDCGIIGAGVLPWYTDVKKVRV